MLKRLGRSAASFRAANSAAWRVIPSASSSTSTTNASAYLSSSVSTISALREAGRKSAVVVGFSLHRGRHQPIKVSRKFLTVRSCAEEKEEKEEKEENDASIVSVSPEERKCFDSYLNQLFEFNSKVNLTAIKTREEANERHIDDSLALLPVLDKCSAAVSGGLRMVDVGSGAGLPGVVIAVKRPEWRLTLVDSLQKRCKFLSEVKSNLELENVSVQWSRAEDLGRDSGHRGTYHVAVARAVAELRVLVELCVPMLEVGGFLVAAKGPNPEEEVEAARNALGQLKSKVVSIDTVSSFGSHGQRTAVVIQKLQETPGKFPRQAGKPNKRPL